MSSEQGQGRGETAQVSPRHPLRERCIEAAARADYDNWSRHRFAPSWEVLSDEQRQTEQGQWVQCVDAVLAEVAAWCDETHRKAAALAVAERDTPGPGLYAGAAVAAAMGELAAECRGGVA